MKTHDLELLSVTPKRLRVMRYGEVCIFKFHPNSVSSAATKEGICVNQKTYILVDPVSGTSEKVSVVWRK